MENSLKQKKVFTQEKSSTPRRIARNTNMAAILLFRNTNMVSVTSFETFYDACDFKPKILVACAVRLYWAGTVKPR